MRLNCPSPERLAQLARGDGDGAWLEQVTSHLEVCEPCERAVYELESRGDSFVQALRSGVAAAIEIDPACHAALQRAYDTVVRDALAETLHPHAGPPNLRFLSPAERPDELGRLGGYRVLRVLGAGGMGIVFAAEDERLHRPVALKVMRHEAAAKPGATERFLREARAAASVRHDHVVTIFQVGEDRQVPFLAMEWLPGQSLEERLRDGAIPVAETVRLGREMASGLAAAHERGLVHRDVKPGNVWLVEGPEPRAKLLDFGLARPTDDTARLTEQGALVGTPAYMAPEQARAAAVGPAADLFSLGCVLYEMLTGERPFPGRDVLEVLSELALRTPPEPARSRPGVSRDLSRLVMRMLDKEPSRRPTAAAVVTELTEQATRIGRQPGRNWRLPLGLVCGGAAIVTVLLSVVLLLSPAGSSDREAAAWALAIGGTITVRNGGDALRVQSSAELPEGKFHLTSLGVSGTGTRDDMLGRIESLRHLESLYIDSTQITDAGLRRLIRLRGLKTLWLGNTAVTDDGLRHLRSLPDLEWLTLGSTETGDAGLRHVAELRRLRMLDLQNARRVTGDGLEHVGSLTELTWLDLTNTSITDDGLRHLRNLSNLVYLRVGRSTVGNRGLESLVEIRSLTDLDLGFSQVTDDGLALLSRLPKLNSLTLAGDLISDAGLEYLVELPLSTLELVDTRVTSAGLSRLPRTMKVQAN